MYFFAEAESSASGDAGDGVDTDVLSDVVFK